MINKLNTSSLTRVGLFTLAITGLQPVFASVQLTTQPETEGYSLFTRAAYPEQNIAGFEFCCGGFDTYQEHGFSQATGDFIKLDGGQWAADINGAIGQRAFASYGDGFDGDWDTSAQHIGWQATGSIRTPEFTIDKTYINFKIGGGSNRFDQVNATSAVLVVDGEWVRHASGDDQPYQLNWQSWDVAEYQGQNAYILLIDMHPADDSDTQLPYLLADEFRAAELAAVEPSVASYVNPENAGIPLFGSGYALDLSGFEFCCGGFDTYQEHGFGNATGDFDQLDGGFWATSINGAIDERIFSSYGDGYSDDQDTSAEQLGGKATGTLDSPEFTINHNFINFLIGGGKNRFDAANATAVVLLVNNQVVRHASGSNQQNQLYWTSWDVSEIVGQTARLRFIDLHPDDNSDNSLPYLLADQFRAADSALVTPDVNSKVDLQAANVASNPESEGIAAFKRLDFPLQNIAGFEFCCGRFDGFHEHGFQAYGDFVRFDGGLWASDIGKHVGDRVFASFGQGFANEADSIGSWYGEETTGRLITPEFAITLPYINFLTGGGTNVFGHSHATAVVLRVNGKVVRQATGNGSVAELDWQSWDVSGLINQQATIEIIDLHDNSVNDGSLPFILVDEIRQAEQAAVTPVASAIVSQVEGHTVPLQLNMGDANPYYEDGEFYLYYLQNSGYHSWYLSKTTDLLTSTFPEQVLGASADSSKQDQWTGSGSVIKDQNGQYHLFYTGHNVNHSPVEAVMHAVASDNTLKSWQTIETDTFTGTYGYSDYDFRDPFVFWNQDEQRYWMLITSRYYGQAVIGLYTSNDLSSWTAQPPLYRENSPLNLEVPEYFELSSTPYIVYSDQRNESPVVKYLVNDNGDWVKANDDQLDGRYFYAARSAGNEIERLLFGWVPHTDGRNDGADPRWGGDLMVHQLHATENGNLAVKLPDKLRQQLNRPLSVEDMETSSGVVQHDSVQSESKNDKAKLQMNNGNIFQTPGAQILLPAFDSMNLLQVDLTSNKENAKLAVVFAQADSQVHYLIELDSEKQLARLLSKNAEQVTELARVPIELNAQQGIQLELFLHPENGVGSLYINQDKALSFRLYQLAEYKVGVQAISGIIEIKELNRFAK
ncbi:hypothetical protein G8764_03440 [Pseudomaricurvus alcaniphilus]|uniref:hypothetical protein n=1 Tax=Pseudomaricurvus alcaniphilus TaxID=1166482 RepID=UPI00140B35F8|nr:hypothetical protein [Pseudomaricurvus alcaniphilus]NHN36340.1 hypothetical protein [Pseudomaricurvus alcaniphilus]